MKLLYTDTKATEHTAKGPYLREGAEGPVAITIAPDGVHWQTKPRFNPTRRGIIGS